MAIFEAMDRIDAKVKSGERLTPQEVVLKRLSDDYFEHPYETVERVFRAFQEAGLHVVPIASIDTGAEKATAEYKRRSENYDQFLKLT